MTIDFLIGAIRASNDLHPLVKTEIEEILWMNRLESKPNVGKTSEEFYTVDDVAEKFGISRKSAYRLCQEDHFPAFLVGGTYRIPKARLYEWIENAINRGEPLREANS